MIGLLQIFHLARVGAPTSKMMGAGTTVGFLALQIMMTKADTLGLYGLKGCCNRSIQLCRGYLEELLSLEQHHLGGSSTDQQHDPWHSLSASIHIFAYSWRQPGHYLIQQQNYQRNQSTRTRHASRRETGSPRGTFGPDREATL